MIRESQAGQKAHPTGTVGRRVLQRKCACGNSAGHETQCEDCKKKPLLRKAAGSNRPSVAPPIVHEVLASPGQPLGLAERSFFEPRFGHDFSKVRVHTDEKAAESARAVNALAYTVGNSMVFDSGQFAPYHRQGRELFAHELAHVVQQSSGSYSSNKPTMLSDANDPFEAEADSMASQVLIGASPVNTKHSGTRLMRKLRILNPAAPIPNPDGKGLKMSNAEAVEGYLKTIASGSGVEVDKTSGKVSVAKGYCPGFLGGMIAGAKTGFGIFKNIPLLNVVLGVPAAIIGGIVGAIGGLFGSKSSAATSSSTPTGSTCLCDVLDSSQDWKIELNDEFPDKNFPHPVTLNGQKIVTFSPNSQKSTGAATMSGKLENYQPWLLLAHELCGHAWLEVKNLPEVPEGSKPAPFAYRDDTTNQVKVVGDLDKNAAAPHGEGHEAAVKRENLIRKEHGLDPRGWRLKDPYCGESFVRDKAKPEGAAQFYPDKEFPGFSSLVEECQYLRDQLPESKTRKFRIDEQIP